MNQDQTFVIESSTTPEEERLLNSLRVSRWQAFHGQNNIKESLKISIQAAKQRTEAIDHILLYGPPGLGKTTLSHLVAKEMGSNITVTSGTALAKSGDLAAILTNLSNQDVLFIDEIHRLSKPVEEMLYSAMEDFALDIVIGKGPSARTVRLDLPHFTLIGATTRYGLLSGPFRDRFGVIHRMEYYPIQDMVEILLQASQTLKSKLKSDSALEIAQRSRGTPRVALRLLKRIRDFAQVKGNKKITPQVIEDALNLLAVDTVGLNYSDRYFLKTIINKHGGGPVGLSTISATLDEDPLTIEEVIEPYLLQLGFLKKTPKGRVILKRAYQHLGLNFPSSQ